MKTFFSWLIAFCVFCTLTQSYAQKYSFTNFVFYLYDGDKLVDALHSTPGLEPRFGHNEGIDSRSNFRIGAMYIDEDAKYQKVRKFDLPGAWWIIANNVEHYRPLRFFMIEKKVSETEVEVMRIFLNYDYDNCNKMPCNKASHFDIADIKFSKGNYMLLAKPTLIKWKSGSNDIVKIKGDFINYIFKNQIKIWDSKRLE